MNRRGFLKRVGALPAAAAVGAVLAKERKDSPAPAPLSEKVEIIEPRLEGSWPWTWTYSTNQYVVYTSNGTTTGPLGGIPHSVWRN